MDTILAASIQDVVRRLRLAGDAHSDLRCGMYCKLKFPFSALYREYGALAAYAAFMPVTDLREFWHYFLFYESQRPNRLPGDSETFIASEAFVDHGTIANLRIRTECLFGDALWLANQVGLSTMPGVPVFDIKKFRADESGWLWLLFHAAWSRPQGTILRAGKWFPNSMFFRTEFSAQKKAESQNLSRRLTDEEQLKLGDSIMADIDRQAEQQLRDGAFISILPVDPFTASAALLEFMLSGNSPPLAGAESKPLPSPSKEHWSAPMSKLEMARRITSNPRARGREVETLLASHRLRRLFGNKWVVWVVGQSNRR